MVDYVQYYTVVLGETMGLATIVLLITAGLIALLYMASKIIQNKRLESWISNEVFQCLATALFVFLSVGLLALFSGVIEVFLAEFVHMQNLEQIEHYITAMSGYDLPHMSFARAYLLSRLDSLSNMYDVMYKWYSGLATAGSVSFFFPEQGTIQIHGATTISKFILPFMQYSFYGFLFLYFQLALLELIKAYFIMGFPAGLVMRSFPFTRTVGSFLIASSIAIYFVYPFLLSVLLLANFQALDVDEGSVLTALSKETPSDFLSYYVSKVLSHEPPQDVEVNPAYAYFKSVGDAMSSIMSFAQFILLTMILYPLVAIVGAYSFMHQFAQLLQANTTDLGRGLVKLI